MATIAALQLQHLLQDAPKTLPDATFVRFKQSWLQSQIGITLLSRREDDDADDHLQELYTRLTERLRTHTDRIARIWTVYALYAMYECQTHRPRKKRIILPQYLWSTLEECVTEFLHLSPRDPIHVLRSLIDRDCFEAHCEPPRRVVEREEAQEEREEEEEKEQEQGEGKTKAEEEIMRKTRSVAQKSLILPSDLPFGSLPSVVDLPSSLQLDQLRALHQAYERGMAEVGGQPEGGTDQRSTSTSAAASAGAPSSSKLLQQIEQAAREQELIKRSLQITAPPAAENGSAPQ